MVRWAVEPGQGALPSVGGGLRVVDGRPIVAVESVVSVGVADDLGRHRRALRRFPELLDLGGGDALVEIAVEPEPGGLELGGQLDQRRQPEPALEHAAAVEGDRRPHRPKGGGVEGDASTHAESHHPDPREGKVPGLEMIEGGVHVDGQTLRRQVAHEGHHRVEVVIGEDRRSVAVEECRRHREPAGVGQPVGDVLDVRRNPERLLDDHDGAAGAPVG